MAKSCAFLVAAIAAPGAWGYPIIFATGPTTGGLDVNAEASFTFNVTSQTITVQLLNLQINPQSVSQLISGVEFDLTNLGAGTLSATINTATANSFDIGGNGAPTVDQQSSTWVVQKIGAGTLALCEICRLGGGGGPSELVIGGPDPATGSAQVYTNAGGSIAGNGPHQPFLLGSGATYSAGPLNGLVSTPTWVLSVPLLTTSSSVGQARFYFGTTFSRDLAPDSVGVASPEPGPIVLMLSGLLLITRRRWSRRRS
jgi:hypothetical protein